MSSSFSSRDDLMRLISSIPTGKIPATIFPEREDMKNILLAVSLVWTSLALGSPILSGGTSVFSSRTRETCSDFSGKWAGTCVHADGNKAEATSQMEQTECYVLLSNKREHPLYGSKTVVFKDDQGNQWTETSNFTWNKKKTELAFTYSTAGLGKIAMLEIGTMKLKGPNTMILTYFHQDGSKRADCELTK
jgi:hypothetical protein